jgi:hypothetical protein
MQEARYAVASLSAAHIPENVWADFIENRADSATKSRVEAHLNTGCKQCAEEQRRWSRLLSALERSRVPMPSDAVLQRAFDLFERLPPRPSVLERIAASLVFDSRHNSLPALARASTGVGFNQVFTAADATVHLWGEFDGVHWRVTGQASSPAQTFEAVIATGEGAGKFQADLDEDGESQLTDLLPDRYDLVVRGGAQEIWIPAVNLETP